MSEATVSIADKTPPVRRQHVKHTEFFNTLMHDFYGPRKGGAKILVDGQNTRLGIGKTSAAVSWARLCAKAFDYELKYDDFTLSGQEYLERYREHPKDRPSVLVLDELVGAGAGDSRKFMANKNVHLARAWTLQRTRRVLTICTLPSWADADKRLRKLADYRMYCYEKPLGSFQPYKLGTFDFSENTNVKFRRLGNRILFPEMDGDPFYEYISEKKEELNDSTSYDADELIEQEDPQQKMENRVKKLSRNGVTQEVIAESEGVSQSTISRIINSGEKQEQAKA